MTYFPLPAFSELFTEMEMYILGLPFEWTERIYIEDDEVYMAMGARYPF